MEPQQMSIHLQLASKPKKRETIEELNAKIDCITQFASKAYFNNALKKLARDQIENATTICDYIIAEQTEINIKQSTKEGKIKILIWLSNFHSGKSFAEMTKVDILNSALLLKFITNRLLQRSLVSFFIAICHI
jgi:predicted RNA-binding protein with EMAP domain